MQHDILGTVYKVNILSISTADIQKDVESSLFKLEQARKLTPKTTRRKREADELEPADFVEVLSDQEDAAVGRPAKRSKREDKAAEKAAQKEAAKAAREAAAAARKAAQESRAATSLAAKAQATCPQVADRLERALQAAKHLAPEDDFSLSSATDALAVLQRWSAESLAVLQRGSKEPVALDALSFDSKKLQTELKSAGAFCIALQKMKAADKAAKRLAKKPVERAAAKAD
jgi:hypothetical protein